jgi:release factor glutamine methyltransferase
MRDFKEFKKQAETKLYTRVTNAKQEFAFLCKGLLNITAADMLTKTELTSKEYSILNKAIKKRLKGVPLQLIIGYTDFLGVEIIETKHTLKPRKETELMVEKIIENEKKDMAVLDLCAGSGCIGLALKKAGFEEVTLSDISKHAIKMCIKNARLNHLPVSVVRSDMFKSILGKFDMIVSNPPYIRTDDINTLSREVKKFDPRIALDGGVDGLSFYKTIANEAPKFLSDNGILYLEIGQNQETAVTKLLERNFKNIIVIKDYNDINRIIRAEKC